MTQINPNLLMPAVMPPQQLGNAIALQVAAGIMGSFMNPLGAGPLASAMLPEMLLLSLFGGRPGCGTGCGTIGICPPILDGGCFPPALPKEPVAQWSTTTTGANTAKVDLGDGYRLEIDERHSQMTIFNENTGERTRIWGDPHVEIDGKHAYDFWGTTTFTLENGTKLTINTEQWNGNPNAYVASQVVITKGSNAIVIDGISQNQLGDLQLTMSNDGYALDAAHRDGFVLNENATGAGWRSEWTGEVATQKDLNVTRVGAEYGPGSTAPSMGELPLFHIMGGMMSTFLLFGTIATLSAVSERAERNIERTMQALIRDMLNA